MLQKLFRKMEPALIEIYRKITDPPIPNLRGDRDIEYSWISGNCPEGPGHGMEFGCGKSYLSLIAVRRGFKMTAIDLLPIDWFYAHPDLTFVQTDLLKMKSIPGSLDLIINCSAVEHVGLTRYGDQGGESGDIKAMSIMREMLKSGGVMLLTIPVGRDQVFYPLHRIYGKERLPRLLEGYSVERSEFWTKDGQNRWVLVKQEEALDRPATAACYGLGCFMLRKR